MSPARQSPIFVVALSPEMARDALRDVDPRRWQYVSTIATVRGCTPGHPFVVLGAPGELYATQHEALSYLREVGRAREITLDDIGPDRLAHPADEAAVS